MRWTDLSFGNDPGVLSLTLGTIAGVLVIAALVRAVVRRRFAAAAGTQTDIDDWLLDVANRTRLWMIVFPMAAAATSGLTLPGQIARAVFVLGRLGAITQIAFWVAGFLELAWRRYARRRIETDRAAITTVYAFRIARQGTHARGLQADPLDRSDIVADADEITDDERLVDHDRQRREQISENALGGESYGHAADAQARHERRDVEAEVVDCDEHGDRPDRRAAHLRRIPTFVREIIEAQPRTRVDRAHFASFGASDLAFEFVYYVLASDYNVYMDVQQAINVAIVERFEREGIEFAYPTQTLFIARG